MLKCSTLQSLTIPLMELHVMFDLFWLFNPIPLAFDHEAIGRT